MRIALLALAVSVLSSSAYAADKPVIAPAPDWVKPVALQTTPGKPDEAAVRILLSDQQVVADADGETAYFEVALRIQTPQGLAAGNISLPWRPETDVLTVHKIQIKRGDQVIDVLKSGQTFTVLRRETNLESATLNGVLTANLQPEGLQVGDVLDMSASITSRDPVLKGHVERVAAAWNGVPIERAHLFMRWPATLKAKVRSASSLPALKPVTLGGATSVELTLDNIEPIVPPKGAPARYGVGRMVELTDFGSWADLAALLAPLYQKAAVLQSQGPLQAEVARIRALSADPKARTEAALALVQDRIRYVALTMGAGGQVPADADTTWARRYGDCKAKTALLIAILHALEIQAEPVMVSSSMGDGLDSHLPLLGLFDHVLVHATLAGRDYWLDGTRAGDTGLDRLTTPAFGWGLPLKTSGASLVRMMPTPLQEPSDSLTIRIDATGGLSVPAPAKAERILRDDAAVSINLTLANLTGDQRDRALRDYWKGEYDSIDVTSASAVFDARTNELRLLMEGKVRMDWSDGQFQTESTDVGYKADFSRDPGPDRDAPFAVAYPFFNRVAETILLPSGFHDLKPGGAADVDQTIAGIEYHRRATITNNVFTVEKTERSIEPEFPFKDAAAAQVALRELADRAVTLLKPQNYVPTEAESAAVIATTPTTAAGFLERGQMLIGRNRFDEAIDNLDHALALEPNNVTALVERGLARVGKGDNVAATKDLDAAAAFQPKNLGVIGARGLMAQNGGAFRDAIAAYTTVLESLPNDAFSLGHRAEARAAVGDSEGALSDAAAALKLNPRWGPLFLLRANLLRNEGKRDEALAEMAAATAANPSDSYTHVAAANFYSAYHREAEAAVEYNRALALKPEGYIYLNRGVRRPKLDVAGRRADADAALKLDPGNADVIAFKSDIQMDAGDYAGAIETLSKAMAVSSDSADLLAKRGMAYLRLGHAEQAEQDFAAARSKSTQAQTLNNLCWMKATANIALESALQDCDAALSKAPDLAGVLDSRAFVLLRLGRFDEAIAAYDKALAKRPDLPQSLYGRAVAWARKGDMARSQADAEAAIKLDAYVKSEFDGYGVKL